MRRGVIASGAFLRRIWVFGMLGLWHVALCGQDYAVSAIPAELLLHANSVIRSHVTEVDIQGPGQYVERVRMVVTVLNEHGKSAALLTLPYDGQSRVRFQGGEIFDAQGKSIKRIRQRDLADFSHVDDFTLFADHRIMIYSPDAFAYPYTVSYEYELSYSRGLYHLYPFSPQRFYNQSVQEAVLRVRHPDSVPLNFKELNGVLGARSSTVLGGVNVHLWHFSQVLAQRHEPLARAFEDEAYMVLITATRFHFNQYQGKSDTWADYGRFIAELNRGRDALPDSRVQYLRELVKDLDGVEEKVRAIFLDMQKRTRYVNISLGIGGLQPFDAATVDRNGYGDCKALSNYFVAMLKAVGIKSHYTLIRTGRGNDLFFPDLIASQFNHVIVCVPTPNDTLWVECTSQQLPFAFLGDSNDNRMVLLITHEGGVLARTPAYARNQNYQHTYARVVLDERGSGPVNLRIAYGGHQFARVYGSAELKEEDQNKWLYSNWALANYTLQKHQIFRKDIPEPRLEIDADLVLRQYATISQQRMLLRPNLLSVVKQGPTRLRNRSSSFELKFESLQTDTVVFELPRGYVLEFLPDDFELVSDFGHYKAQYTFVDGELRYTRCLELFAGVFAPQRYADFVAFYQQLIRADARELVLVPVQQGRF